jgi:hypothetical protein
MCSCCQIHQLKQDKEGLQLELKGVVNQRDAMASRIPDFVKRCKYVALACGLYLSFRHVLAILALHARGSCTCFSRWHSRTLYLWLLSVCGCGCGCVGFVAVALVALRLWPW